MLGLNNRPVSYLSHSSSAVEGHLSRRTSCMADFDIKNGAEHSVDVDSADLEEPAMLI